jgi:hypothetical protein
MENPYGPVGVESKGVVQTPGTPGTPIQGDAEIAEPSNFPLFELHYVSQCRQSFPPWGAPRLRLYTGTYRALKPF